MSVFTLYFCGCVAAWIDQFSERIGRSAADINRLAIQPSSDRDVDNECISIFFNAD